MFLLLLCTDRFLPFILRPSPISTLFPYTTLFRSHARLRPGLLPAGQPRRRLHAGAGADPRAAVLRADPEREPRAVRARHTRSEEHTSELQSPCNLVCRLLLEKKKLDARKFNNSSQ